jgi:hypothetical protein
MTEQEEQDKVLLSRECAESGFVGNIEILEVLTDPEENE